MSDEQQNGAQQQPGLQIAEGEDFLIVRRAANGELGIAISDPFAALALLSWAQSWVDENIKLPSIRALQEKTRQQAAIAIPPGLDMGSIQRRLGRLRKS